MDSPESSKPTTITCETAPAQDSPVFSYISNLSPIQPVKAPSVTQGFPGLNSPPLVFTSPRLNPHKRPQLPRPSVAKLPGPLEGHGNLDIQLIARLVACGDKGSDTNNNVNDLIQSPSGCSEQFLTDIVNVESVDPDLSLASTIKKPEYNDQSPTPTCSKEVLISKNKSRIIEGIAVEPLIISKQTEEVHKENPLINLNAAEKDIKQIAGLSIDHCPKLGPELLVDHGLANQDEDSLTESVEAGQDAPSEQSFNMLSGSGEIGQGNEIFVEPNGTTLAVPVINKVQSDLKAFQHRGARRRCLQFEDARARHKVISNQLAQNPSECEEAKLLSLETPLTPTNGEHDDMIQPMLYTRNRLNSLIKIPKPSGIGLHLNSFVNTVHNGSSAIITVKAAQEGEFNVIECLPTTDDIKHESHASVVADLAMALATHIVKSSNNSVVLNSKANYSTPCNKRKSTEKVGGSNEINNLVPKKIRMKSLDLSDIDGCKHCNCKRSKCLKLYCDCFAAGIYCADPCACEECFNRPEYVDTVLETRQKIESRDPFAFAPKVVQGIIEQPARSYGEDETHFTPASARHKKGCKCKKSMCLKKYCECYQSNVECSDGCRCEGCKNVYGQKGEYGTTQVVLIGEDTNETTDGSFVEKIEMFASGNGIVNQHDLTPLTPAVQFSNCGKDASKAWIPSGKYLQSTESSFSYVEPYMMSPGLRQNSDDKTISETTMEILDLVSSDQESHHCNADTVNEFSEALQKSGNMGPFFGIPNLQKWAYNSKDQSCSAQRNYFSGTSLIWRGSPTTPLAQFSGSKALQEVGIDFDLSNIAPDDTPEMLKDSSAPLKTVKVSSPNKKRVSPPHGRLYELGSSSSAGNRTGRKFILKAVPSFPPLTPCIDSKTSDVQKANNPDNHSANK